METDPRRSLRPPFKKLGSKPKPQVKKQKETEKSVIIEEIVQPVSINVVRPIPTRKSFSVKDLINQYRR